MNKYVNPANAITASRYLTLPPFVYWLERGDYQYALLMIIVCGVLDLFDGAVARAFGCASGFGEMLDAVTDALCYGFFLAVLAVYELLPAIPIFGLIGLGAVNALFRAIYSKRAGRVTNYRSYASERLLAYTAYLAGFGVANFEPAYYAWTCFGMMIVIMLHDTKRMLFDPVPSSAASSEEAAA